MTTTTTTTTPAPRVLTFVEAGILRRIYKPSSQDPSDEAGLRKTFLVVGTVCGQDRDAILNAPGLPQIGDPETINGKSVTCVNVTFEESEESVSIMGFRGKLYEVVAEYENRPQDDQPVNPLDRKPSVSWDSEPLNLTPEKDIDGNPITNPVGERVLIEEPLTVIVLTIRRLEAWPYDYKKIYKWGNKVNRLDFLDVPRGCALMMPPKVQDTTENSTRYAEVTYTIKFRLELDPAPTNLPFRLHAWQPEVLVEGSRYVWFRKGKEYRFTVGTDPQKGIRVKVSKVLEPVEDDKTVNLIWDFDGTQHGWRCNWVYPFQAEGVYSSIDGGATWKKQVVDILDYPAGEISGTPVTPVRTPEGPFYHRYFTKYEEDFTPLNLEAAVR